MYYACSCSWATYVLDFEPETTPNNVAGSFTRGMNCFGYARLHLRRLHGRWCRDASTKRKRGRRGGVKNRLRRQPATPPPPYVVFANVQSLYNTIDELHAKCRYDNVYREACVVAFCETWLDSTRPDDDSILDGFTVYRSDRTKESGKTRGGGLCIYINNRWCSKAKIHTTLCSPNLELLTLSVRPFIYRGNLATLYYVVFMFHPVQTHSPQPTQ